MAVEIKPANKKGQVKSRREKIHDLLETLDKKVSAADRVSVADYVRLVTLERELEESEGAGHVKELRVSWVDQPIFSELDR